MIWVSYNLAAYSSILDLLLFSIQIEPMSSSPVIYHPTSKSALSTPLALPPQNSLTPSRKSTKKRPSQCNTDISLKSDGQLLCHSYNAVLRSSTRPFGFIPSANIHEALVDTSSLNSSPSSDLTITEGRQKVGATFRRIENLRIWGA